MIMLGNSELSTARAEGSWESMKVFSEVAWGLPEVTPWSAQTSAPCPQGGLQILMAQT